MEPQRRNKKSPRTSEGFSVGTKNGWDSVYCGLLFATALRRSHCGKGHSEKPTPYPNCGHHLIIGGVDHRDGVVDQVRHIGERLTRMTAVLG